MPFLKDAVQLKRYSAILLIQIFVIKVQDIVEDEPKKKVVIEDNLWKTTDIKEEEVE